MTVSLSNNNDRKKDQIQAGLFLPLYFNSIQKVVHDGVD